MELSELGVVNGDIFWFFNCIFYFLYIYRVREIEREFIFSKRIEDNMVKMEEVRIEK